MERTVLVSMFMLTLVALTAQAQEQRRWSELSATGFTGRHVDVELRGRSVAPRVSGKFVALTAQSLTLTVSGRQRRIDASQVGQLIVTRKSKGRRSALTAGLVVGGMALAVLIGVRRGFEEGSTAYRQLAGIAAGGVGGAVVGHLLGNSLDNRSRRVITIMH